MQMGLAAIESSTGGPRVRHEDTAPGAPTE
jgi:hypothetical protein